MEINGIQHLAARLKQNVNRVIVGKEDIIDQLLIAIIASGHILLEDVPGTGKTLLAKSMARSLDSDFRRIQFTPDLLPSDLSGVNFFNQKKSEFEFRPGPLFTNILLADEINRATPRTQSSLLECMEERQVTIDGRTYALAQPFLVIATQNPLENAGTFPLPEAQLDRFLLKVKMGYPSKEEGLSILKRFRRDNPLEQLAAVASAEQIVAAQQHYTDVYVADDMYTYLLDIVEQTREHTRIAMGVSPRGSQALLKTAQVRAILSGRDYVTPDDVKAMVKPVLGHRIILSGSMGADDERKDNILDEVLSGITVPAEDALIRG